MYCLDSLGTDIDHFEPLSRAPLRTFCWHNHLLACSRCNTTFKGDKYPCDEETGECLLIDPSADDPADHLELLVKSGEYDGRTRKGEASIKVFGLNREDLVLGRIDAYTSSCDALNSWHRKVLRGDLAEAARSATALRREPFGDVLRALEKLGRLPYAAAALGDELADSLSAWLHRLPHQAATTSQPHVGSDDTLAR
ncbi:HNH endonuclease [Streptomyces kronopolitis]